MSRLCFWCLGLSLGLLALAACGDEGAREIPMLGERPLAEFYIEPDRFRSATEPPLRRAEHATFLQDAEEVYGIVVDGAARAYPIRILGYHHVVNDVIAGREVAVTYCVICSSGICYDPHVQGRRLIFGVHGAWSATATLYDIQTDSVWMQLTGHCVAGPLQGEELDVLPTGRHTSWKEWRTTHPGTTVMAPMPAVEGGPEEGVGYLTRVGSQSGSAFVPKELRETMPEPEGPLEPNTLVHGLVVAEHSRAYPLANLRRSGVIEEDLGGVAVSIWFHEPSQSAVAFLRRLGDAVLSFRRGAADTIRDTGTGSRWNLEGVCVDGAMKGRRLERPLGHLAEWYGWQAHHPATTVYLGP